jgi:hypothetical protein
MCTRHEPVLSDSRTIKTYPFGGRQTKGAAQIIWERECADGQAQAVPEGKFVAAERHSRNLRTVVREESYDAESQPDQRSVVDQRSDAG